MTKRGLVMLAFGLLTMGVLGTYIYFQTYNIAQGPEIAITAPKTGETVGPEILVSGRAKNVSRLFLNDTPIFTDGSGNFREVLLLARGYTIITVRGEDRFGRVEKREIEVNVK